MNDTIIASVITGSLVLWRIASLLVAAPVLSSRAVPVQVKVGLALTITIVVLGPMPPAKAMPADVMTYVSMAFVEVIVGLILGFATGLVFNALQTAAHLMGLQAGFSPANIMDPMFDGGSTVLDTFYTMFGTMVFLTINGHHWLLQGVIRSYDTLPIGATIPMDQAVERLLGMTVSVWIVALQLALPVAGALLLADVALGILARTVPQLNLFSIGAPVKLTLALVLLIITMPAAASFLDAAFRTMTAQSFSVLIR